MNMISAAECQDTNEEGSYFGASLRKGPFLNKQEDRVSILYFDTRHISLFLILCHNVAHVNNLKIEHVKTS